MKCLISFFFKISIKYLYKISLYHRNWKINKICKIFPHEFFSYLMQFYKKIYAQGSIYYFINNSTNFRAIYNLYKVIFSYAIELFFLKNILNSLYQKEAVSENEAEINTFHSLLKLKLIKESFISLTLCLLNLYDMHLYSFNLKINFKFSFFKVTNVKDFQKFQT